MAAADDFAGLMTTRFFLGALEAGVSPCFVLLTTMFYKRSVTSGRGRCGALLLLLPQRENSLLTGASNPGPNSRSARRCGFR